jgi:hypothetical protein
LQEERTDWLTFVARYRDGSLDRFAVDPFTVLRGNYIAGNDARKRQEEGNLKLGEIVLVYRDAVYYFSYYFSAKSARP